MELTISIIYGSVRAERKGIQAARYLERKLAERGQKVHFIDPAEYKLPLLDKMYKEFAPGTAPEAMEKVSAMLKESDGFLIVSGEYNHSVPPALKNLLDHFQREYYFKPSGIACYSKGAFGGVRAATHLREIVAELGMPSISSILPFPGINDLFDKDLIPQNEKVERTTKRFLDEFEWFCTALKKQRLLEGTPY